MPFIYPTSYELRQLEPDLLARKLAGRLGLAIMPVRTVNAAKVRWTQKDNYYGLQQLRGMDGEPTHVSRVGERSFEYEPGVFGEFIDLTETELTIRAGAVDPATVPIPIEDLIVEAKDILIGREIDRMESSNWSVLTTGVIEIVLAGDHGQQIGYRDSYPILTYSALIPWSTVATATPMRNFQAIQQMGLAAGRSVDFGAGATAYMNTITANNLLLNQNEDDLFGRKTGGGGTFNTLTEITTLLQGLNMPKIVVYDQGYIPFKNAPFKKYIPDGKVVVVGQRPSGAVVGNYVLTRCASNNFRPGSYEYVKDRANGTFSQNALAEKRTPANIEIHRGHNGGPTIEYPSSVIVMSV